MKYISWFLLILSAILYPLPLIFSEYLWWLAFLFPIPFFYVAIQEDLGFKEGVVWGTVAIVTHLVGVLIGIDGYTSSDDGLARLLPVLMLLVYIFIFYGPVFWLTTWIKKTLKLTTPFAIILLWVIVLWCIIFFLDRMCLWPFDRFEGYFAFHPILALARHPQLLLLAPIIGKNMLALLLYLVPASITLFIVEPTRRHALLIAAALTPWCISLLMARHVEKPNWLDTIAVLPATFPRMIDSVEQAGIAQHYLKKTAQQYPQAEIIILPESAFNCDHLSTEPILCNMWSKAHLGKPLHILLGAFRWEQEKFRNSLHWIYDGALRGIFDKRHAMVLLERVPSSFDFPILHQLFFKEFHEVTPSLIPRPRFEITERFSCTPYICSELFFNEYPDDTYPTTPILAVTNDLWCINTYVTELMYLDARLKAIQWQRDILYVSFKYASYLDRYGNELPLARLTS